MSNRLLVIWVPVALLLKMSPFHRAQLAVSEAALGLMKLLPFDIQFLLQPPPSTFCSKLRTVLSLTMGAGSKHH